jgi:hypothetical protein
VKKKLLIFSGNPENAALMSFILYVSYFDIFRLPGSRLTTEKERIQKSGNTVLTSFWFQQLSFNSIKKQHAKKYLVAHGQG